MYNALTRQPAPGMGGIWDTIKDVGGKVIDTAGDLWGGGSDDMGLQDVLSQGIDAAAQIIRNGTERQIAQLFMQRMSPEVRSELEREYLAQHGRQFIGSIPVGPVLIGGAILAFMLLKKRRR